jgi:hypothetical protein
LSGGEGIGDGFGEGNRDSNGKGDGGSEGDSDGNMECNTEDKRGRRQFQLNKFMFQHLILDWIIQFVNALNF